MNPLHPANHHAKAALGVAVLTAVLGAASLAMASGTGGMVTIRYEGALALSQNHDGRARPAAVTCDAVAGEICVTDAAYSALHLFNAAGAETFRTGGFANVTAPNDGAVDHEGRLVTISLVDGKSSAIARLDVYGEPDGYRVEQPAADWRPTHLLVTRDGHYVTVDGASGLMAKHDANTGAVLWAETIGGGVGDDASLDMNLGRPAEMSDGTFCVPGGNLHVMLVVSEDGRQLSSFGRVGSSPGRMVYPVAAAAGPGGTLLVLDQLRHKIMAFDGQHEFLSEYGSIGDTPGAFYYPASMATDGNGHVYVAQSFRSLVQVFNVQADGTAE